MKELREFGVSYDEALRHFEAAIEDGRRQWAARLLQQYPYREDLEMTAEALLLDIKANAVEVNAIVDSHQETLVKAPIASPVSIPQEESLCVLTVGAGEPLSVSDIRHENSLNDHPVKVSGDICAWASAPIIVEGSAAGTICALENGHARAWNDRDQALLEKAAGMIGAQVSEWATRRGYLI